VLDYLQFPYYAQAGWYYSQEGSGIYKAGSFQLGDINYPPKFPFKTNFQSILFQLCDFYIAERNISTKNPLYTIITIGHSGDPENTIDFAYLFTSKYGSINEWSQNPLILWKKFIGEKLYLMIKDLNGVILTPNPSVYV
jgi:hypothetical protein